MAEFAGSQFPRVIPGRRPTIKPESWYPNLEKPGRILDLAIQVRGSRGEAFKWLGQENSHLGGRIPLDMLETELGTDEILVYIHRWIADCAPLLNGSEQ